MRCSTNLKLPSGRSYYSKADGAGNLFGGVGTPTLFYELTDMGFSFNRALAYLSVEAELL